VSSTLNPNETINQFVWLLRPCVPERAPRVHATAQATTDTALAVDQPLLSIGVRTQGKRNDLLLEALFSIYGQDSEDYEVIVCFHKATDADSKAQAEVQYILDTLPVQFRARVRMITCTEPGRSAPLNAIVEAAHGQYFGFLDDDDLLFPTHVSTLAQGVAEHGIGPIFQTFAARRRISVREEKPKKRRFGFRPRTLSVMQTPVTYPYTTEVIEPAWITPYDPVTQQYNNDIPNCCFLVPHQLIDQTNLRFRTEFDLAEDWEFLMRASSFLKVITLPEVTAAINVRNNESNTVQNAELQPLWVAVHRKRLDEQASRPLLLEGRSAHLLFRKHIETEIRREQIEAHVAALNSSLAAFSNNRHELAMWAQGLEDRLIAVQGEYQRLSAWAQDLERRVQSHAGGGLRGFVRRFIRTLR
jgi:glycosyltransferase involved in cell wall biosynthesis